MKLFSNIDLPEVERKISYQSNLFFIGSCFTENIGNLFKESYFCVQQNPLGIIFHPFGIEAFFQLVAKEKNTDKSLLLQTDSVWKTYQAHSSVNATSKDELIHLIESRLDETRAFLQQSTHIFISLGTAWGYFLNAASSNKFVVNCHKQPNHQFTKEIASVQALKESLQNSIQLIRQLTSAKIWFTISPVRHKKDGWTQNTRSKSHLFAALHECIDKSDDLHYFPAYEIMMDELRDYRFYDKDLVHPNSLAIEYLWEKIQTNFIDEASQKLLEQVEAYRKLHQHRPQHQANFENHIRKVEELKNKLTLQGVNIKDE